MIQANEIRIGNIIWESTSFTPAPEDFNEIIVASINDIDRIIRDDQENGYSFDMLHGIPLTAEWLEKFGFWKREMPFSGELGYCMAGNGDFIGFVPRADNGWLIHNPHFSTTYFYVHQLQNLYFALTGEELTIKK